MRSSGRNTGSNRDNRGAGNKRDDKQKSADRPRPEERRYEQGASQPRTGGKAGPGARGGAKSSPKGSGPKGGGSRESGPRGSAPRSAERKSGAPKSGAPRSGDQRTGGAPKSGDSRPGAPKSGAPKSGAPKSGAPRFGAPKQGSGPKSAAAKSAQKRAGKNTTSSVTKSGAPKSRTRKASAPSRPREYDAKVEERNRARYSGEEKLQIPKTFGEVDGERLQKVMARAGMGSRRACEDLIAQARVEINGQIVLEQGVRVDPAKDEIKVDGLTIATQSYIFLALPTPAGVVASMEDPDGRQCLGDYVQNRETRLFHVGRLDTETEGLILLTNHGELAHRLTHPRYGVKKTYLAAIQGPIPRDLGKQLKDGIRLDDGFARADHFKVVENTGKNYLVEVSLHEGRKHIVRRMLSEAGFPVEKLVRTRFGPIPLGDQKSGWLRRMTNTEVGMLMNEVGL